MSDKHVKERLLKYFDFSEPSSISGGSTIPLSTAAESILATIDLKRIHSNDRELIQATIGWQATTTAVQNAEIRFRIRRDGAAGTVVFDTVDGTGTTATGRRFTTGLTHAETGVVPGEHTYTLTAQTITANAVLTVIGPINLDGSVIDENDT